MSKIQAVPNNLAVLSGGTRQGLKVNRPWQSEIETATGTCPFDDRSKPQVHGITAEKGWRVLTNEFTPYPLHYLIVPEKCWPTDRLRSLGDESEIAAVLRTVRAVLKVSKRELWLGVHVGPLAGQNIAHLHYHLLQPARPNKRPRNSASIYRYCDSSGIEIFSQDGLRVVAGGVKAGQCFIYPQSSGSIEFTVKSATALARVLSRLIGLCNDKFTSDEGLPPDFMVGIKFFGGKFSYGYYLPILNNWGFTEYFALMESTPFTLPWSHEESVDHLLSSSTKL